MLDRRLDRPEQWCEDSERRERAKVPAEVVFQTQPEQARAMLEHAGAVGLPMRWVTGDAVYGEAPELRAAISDTGRWDVLGVRQHQTVWLERPALVEPGPSPPGPSPVWPTTRRSHCRWSPASPPGLTVPGNV